jgi:hypothetical protein
MKEYKIIGELIKEIAETARVEVMQGTVSRIGTNGTIDVELDANVVVSAVRLSVIVGEQDYIVEPALNSPVIICSVDGGQDYQVLHAARVNRFYLRTGNQLMELTANGLVINEGKLGGLPKIAVLKSELTKLNNNITLLRQACSAMATTLNTLAPGISAAFEAAVAGIQPVDVSQLENTKVKQ